MGAPHFDDLPWLLEGLFRGWPLWAASLGGAALGALIGGGSLWLMGWTWEKLRGIEAMGLGDVKMMFMVGAYLMASDDSDDFHRRVFGIGDWYRSDDGARP